METKFTRPTKIGNITLCEEGGFITKLKFLVPDRELKNNPPDPSPLIAKAFAELDDYFLGRLKKFTIPLNPKGTVFQKKVWSALLKIEYGKTQSYKDIAIKIGNSKAVRAVGMANNKNPIAIIIPCHRVVGSNGKLVGYAGGLDLKEKLLNLEFSNP